MDVSIVEEEKHWRIKLKYNMKDVWLKEEK